MEMHSSTTAKTELDHSDLGPTITIKPEEMSKLDSYDFIKHLGDSRWWMFHAPVGDDPAAAQRWLDSLLVPQQVTYRVDTEDEHTHAQGTGKLMPGNGALPFQFEVDVGKKIYALKCPYIFLDVPATGTKVRGETRRKVFNDWVTEPFERHFSGFFPTMKSVTPALGGNEGILRGALPEQVGTIAATDTFQYEGYTDNGTIVIHYALSPTPPQETELVIKADAHYMSWRPNGGMDEVTPGPDPLMVEAKLQRKGGGDPPFKAIRFTYKLLNTSKELGVCMNWPPSPLKEQPFDLQIVQDPSRPQDEQLLIDQDGQKAVETGEGMTSAKVQVASFDWGAHGAIEIVAELDNHNLVTGTVEGTNEHSLKLPYRTPGSNVARMWATFRGVVNVPDDSDQEDDPKGDGFRGDGFTQYEEYRGFMEGGKWTEANPKKKDVFVLNFLRTAPIVGLGIGLYQRISELAVHSKLVETEVRLDKVINFNHSAGPHLVDQHVILIREGGWKEEGTGLGISHVFAVGTPRTAGAVNVYLFRKPGDTSDENAEQSSQVIAHEMLHDSNVYHHGERDTQVAWHVSVDESGRAHITESSGNPLFGPSGAAATVASWIGLGEVEVRYEDGYPVQAADLPPEEILTMGQQHGQHSGDVACVMRYDVANAYPSLTEPNVRYLALPKEHEGRGLCSSPDGTLVNASGRRPQSRYGDAAMSKGSGVKLPRGDCKHQIRVNDMGEEPQR